MSQFLSFAGFELRYHLRRPVNYVFMAMMFFLGFLFVASPAVRIGGVSGAVHINAPYVINTAVMILTLVGMIVTSAIAGTAILRDFEFKTHELLFTTRLKKSSFVFGRFVGAWVVTVIVLACCSLGLWFGAHMPWLDQDKLGPAVSGMYLWPLVLYVLPGALFTCALFFAVGVLTRSFLAVYIQGVVLFVGWSIAQRSISDLDNELLGALLDPFGITASGLAGRYWTVDEQNTQLLGLVGPLLYNRLLWMAIGVLVLLGAFKLFRMEAFPGARRAKRDKVVVPEVAKGPRDPQPLPAASQSFGLSASLTAFATMTRLYYLDIVRARAFRAITAIGMLYTIYVSTFSDRLYGTTIYPVTYAVIEVIEGFGLFFLILTAVYVAELMWRERGLKCDQIHDASPASDTATFASKVVSLLLVYATLILMLIAVGVTYQTFKGYTNYELGVYFTYLYGVTFPSLALIVLLAFFLQTLVNNKYLGISLIVLYYVLTLVLSVWGVDNRLARYDNAPTLTYSAMNGFGPNVGMYISLTAYYAAFAMVLLAIARLLLPRGTNSGWRTRLRLARSRVTPAWFAFLVASMAAWFGLGGYAYYNIHVLNTYRNTDASEALQAEYERTYKQYLTLPQPRIIATDVHVDLYPETGKARAKGSYRLVNRHDVAIDVVHVLTAEDNTVHSLEFDGGATLEQEDPRLRYQIWRLARPLQPREETTLRFDIGAEKDGFANGGRGLKVLANGSFLNNSDMMPFLGYQEGFELGDPDKRKKQGLPDKPLAHPIDDMRARQNTYIAADSDWISFKASVCTAPDQIAIAPGYLEKEWEQDGRRCFAYSMGDTKILHFYSFLSARYEVLRDQHKGINIEIYYQKGHEYNLARMVDSIKKSLDYFQANFSPYQHRQVRILEFPRYASFAQSFPNTIPYSESIGFIARVRDDDPEDLDYPFYITAHEVAHQWWAHQVIGADVQGATMLSESLSQYAALMVMEDEFGPDKMKKFLAYELRGYLQGRGFERRRELSLMRNEGQGYIRYQKGSLVFYLLKDLLGEDVVNKALARLIREQAFKGPPFALADDLVDILREVTPPDLQYLITDLFEKITLYDNKTSEPEVTAKDGKYHIRFKVHIRKVHAGDLGKEEAVPFDDYIDVGVFAAPGPSDYVLGKPLFFERRKFKSTGTDKPAAEQVIEVVVDEPPYRAGIDPYNKLIDRVIDDNTAAF
jgi:ABC-2 type transport system permease protein